VEQPARTGRPNERGSRGWENMAPEMNHAGNQERLLDREGINMVCILYQGIDPQRKRFESLLSHGGRGTAVSTNPKHNSPRSPTNINHKHKKYSECHGLSVNERVDRKTEVTQRGSAVYQTGESTNLSTRRVTRSLRNAASPVLFRTQCCDSSSLLVDIEKLPP
jgi:hypothetical protein